MKESDGLGAREQDCSPEAPSVAQIGEPLRLATEHSAVIRCNTLRAYLSERSFGKGQRVGEPPIFFCLHLFLKGG